MNAIRTTQALRLIQLGAEDIAALARGEGMSAFEKKMGLTCGSEPDEGDETSSPEFYQPYHASIQSDPENMIWYLPWQIIHKEDNAIIGGILFKGGPNGRGEVEVGYGLNGAYQNRGYMTQAVASILEWALDQPDVQAVVAETDKDNIASQRVVQKNGMRALRKTDAEVWWTTRP